MIYCSKFCVITYHRHLTYSFTEILLSAVCVYIYVYTCVCVCVYIPIFISVLCFKGQIHQKIVMKYLLTETSPKEASFFFTLSIYWSIFFILTFSFISKLISFTWKFSFMFLFIYSYIWKFFTECSLLCRMFKEAF